MMRKKLALIVVDILDALTPACRADLVSWLYLRAIKREDVDFTGRNCQPGGCYFVDGAGGCYCGKYRKAKERE